MKAILLLFTFLISDAAYAQKSTALPHGMVFGIKPNTVAMMDASKIEEFMGKRTRTSATLRGRVLKVIKSKGGWFDIDAGKGKVIAAHFTDYKINIPLALKGKIVIAEGIAAKQFIADDLQHFAGDTVTGKKQHNTNVDPKRRLTFEVKGLSID